MKKPGKRKLKKIRKKKVIKIKSESKSRKRAQTIKVTVRRKPENGRLVAGLALKTTAILLIVCLNWTGLSAVLNTFAFFNDTESSSGNTYTVGSLDFSLRSGQSNFVPTDNMIPGSSVARDIYIKKDGTLPFKYKAHSEPTLTSCDMDLYDSLELEVWYNYYTVTPTPPNYHEHRTMALKYDGLLKDFIDFDTNLDDLDLRIPNSHPYFDNTFYGPDEHWLYYKVTLPDGAPVTLQNKFCQFKFVFDGWQTDLPDSSIGFSDTEEIISSVSTGDWSPQVEMIYPNGGESWWIVSDSCPSNPSCSAWCESHGMNADCEYNLQWSATNKIGPDEDLWIDIHYLVDSGSTTVAQIVNDTNNDGTFLWKIPYDPAYISDEARIKVTATHETYPSLTAWDMSDADFCPPMLSETEIIMMMFSPPDLGVLDNSGGETNDLPKEELGEENDSIDQGTTTEDEQGTTTDESVVENSEVNETEESGNSGEESVENEEETRDDEGEEPVENEEGSEELTEKAILLNDIEENEENAETTEEFVEEIPEEPEEPEEEPEEIATMEEDTKSEEESNPDNTEDGIPADEQEPITIPEDDSSEGGESEDNDEDEETDDSAETSEVSEDTEAE